VKVGSTPNDGDVLDGAVWFPDMSGGLYRIGQRSKAVTGPFPLRAGNPFTLSAYAGRLWIADLPERMSSSLIRPDLARYQLSGPDRPGHRLRAYLRLW
jgi:hypothetical protein